MSGERVCVRVLIKNLLKIHFTLANIHLVLPVLCTGYLAILMGMKKIRSGLKT